jgi:hypothetical protein
MADMRFKYKNNNWQEIHPDPEEKQILEMDLKMRSAPLFKVGDMIKGKEGVELFEAHSVLCGTILSVDTSVPFSYYMVMDAKSGEVKKQFSVFVDDNYELVN